MKTAWLLRLSLGTCILHAVVFLTRPVTSYRTIALGGDATEVGLVTAAFSILPIVFALPLGRMVDKRQVSGFLAAGAALVAAGAAGMALAQELAGLLVASAAMGMGHLILVAAAQSLIARRSPANLHDRDFGMFTAAASLGQLFGPIIGGFVLNGASGAAMNAATQRAFVLAAILALPAIPLSLRLDGPVRPVRPRAGAGARSDVRSLLFAPGIASTLLVSIMLVTSVDMLSGYVPLLAEHVGIGPAAVGVLLGLRAGMSFMSRVLIGPIRAMAGRTTLITMSAAGSALTLALLPLIPNVWAWGVILTIAGFFLGLAQPLTMSLVVESAPPGATATALALRLGGNRVGQVVIPAAAGVLAGTAGIAAVFWLLGGLLAAGAALARRTPT